MLFKTLACLSLGVLASVASPAIAQTDASDPHYYSHYKPYFPPGGSIPSQSTYKRYFPPAYSAKPAKSANLSFGARVVDTGSHIDLLHRNVTGATVDANTGRAKFSYSPPPGSYHGDVWNGYYGGCKARWFWDSTYHKYVKQPGCL